MRLPRRGMHFHTVSRQAQREGGYKPWRQQPARLLESCPQAATTDFGPYHRHLLQSLILANAVTCLCRSTIMLK